MTQVRRVISVDLRVLQFVASHPGKHVLHDAPVHCALHVHVLGAVHEPWTHVWLQMAVQSE